MELFTEPNPFESWFCGNSSMVFAVDQVRTRYSPQTWKNQRRLLKFLGHKYTFTDNLQKIITDGLHCHRHWSIQNWKTKDKIVDICRGRGCYLIWDLRQTSNVETVAFRTSRGNEFVQEGDLLRATTHLSFLCWLLLRLAIADQTCLQRVRIPSL